MSKVAQNEAIEQPEKNPDDYKNGDCTPGGAVIKKILGKASNSLVFTTETGILASIIKDETVVHEYTAKCNKVLELHEALPKNIDRKRFVKLLEELGLVFFNSLESKGGETAEQHFSRIESKINEAIYDANEELNTNFIIWNIVHTAIASAALGILYYFLSPAPHSASLLVAIGGALGACISVIQRNKAIELRRIRRTINLHFSSAISVTLGAASAFVVYWAITGNLILGSIAGNIPAVFVFGVISGMSERYLNSLLSKIQSRK